MKDALTDNGIDAQVAAAFNDWVDQGEMPAELSRTLRASLRRSTRPRRLRVALKWSAIAAPAVALVLIAVLALSPVTAAWARQLPVIGRLIGSFSGIRQGWAWAQANGFLQDIGTEATDNGCTFRVDSVLADPTETTIFWTVTGDRPRGPDFGPGASILFNGEQFVTHGETMADFLAGKTVGDTGNTVAGSFSCDALPAASGTLDLTLGRIGDVEGNWHVNFAVDRTRATELTTTLNPDQEVPCGGGVLKIERVVLSPTRTMVDASWTGPSTTDGGHSLYPRLMLDRVALVKADGTRMAPLQMAGGAGKEIGGGLWETRWTLGFDRVDPSLKSLALTVGGEVYVPGETRVPLLKGQTVTAADGRALTIADITGSARDGGVRIEYKAPSQPTFPYEGWQVSDQNGVLHEITRGEGEETDGNAWLIQRWHLAEGSEAAELVSPGFWQATEFGRIQIDTHK